MTDAPRRCGAAIWSLSGVKRTPRDHRKSVATDPERPIAANLRCNAAEATYSYADL
jgi:hypothetical protein